MTDARTRPAAASLVPTPPGTAPGLDDVAAERARRPPRSFFASSLRRFVGDKLSLAALLVFALIVVVTLLAPLIAEHLLGTTPEELLRTPEGRIATLQPPGPC